MGDLPSGVQIRRESSAPADVVLLFATRQADLVERFSAATDILADGGRLWILWQKRTSRITTDVSEREVRAFGLARDFVDYKISAIDATWSGLCFARRRPDSG